MMRLADDALLADAIEIANVPTLLMVLVQLTGELRWLDSPYRPVKSRGLSDNETGGLPVDVQREVRAAALDAVRAWRDGKPAVLERPSLELLVEMMSVAMGEPIAGEYGPMIAGQLGIHELAGHMPDFSTATIPDGFNVLIIGAGVSGICAAVRLQEAGIAFTIIERHTDVGGVWLANRYPGAGVDTPSHIYAFSFAPNDWERYFSAQDEILEYLRSITEMFDLRPHIEFGSSVERAKFDESTQLWTLELVGPDGANRTLEANVVISAVGAFNKPKLPNFTGMNDFAGPNFHTADWEDIDLNDKRVAVVGNGASAMQVVPAIVDTVRSLVVFQHSPQWASPFEKFQKPIPSSLRALLTEVPLYHAWYRARLAWIFNDRLHASLQKDPNWEHPERSINPINDAHRRALSAYIESELGERRDLLDKVMPTYPPFGKRMLLDNGWFRAVGREHVTLDTDGVGEVRKQSIVSRVGNEYDVDIIVWATGFDVVRFLAPMEIVGRNGVRLHDAWDGDDARAFLGTAVPSFPNFFMLYGPNTQFGHGGSLITLMERQVHYLMCMLEQMFVNNVASIEVKHDIYDDYNRRIDDAHEHMVWTHKGMDTYYRNSRGRVVVNNPFRMQQFWDLTADPTLNDYLTTAGGTSRDC